ncbi:MAG TPA: sensor histidine kinase [Micromonosporaceae bacterium]
MVLILVPLCSLIGLWGYAVSLTVEDTLAVNLQAKVDAAVHKQTGRLFDALQGERRTSTIYLAGNRTGSVRGTLTETRQVVDREADGLRKLVTGDVLADVNPSERAWIQEALRRLTALNTIRSEIDTGTVTRSHAENRFTGLIKACLGVFTMMTTDKNPHFGFYHQTMVALHSARELLSQEDALLVGVLTRGRLTPAEYDTFVTRVGAHRALLAEAEADITDDAIVERYQRAVQTDAFTTLSNLEDTLIKRGRGQQTPPFSLSTWETVQAQVFSDLRSLENYVYDSLVAHAAPVVIGIITNLLVMVLLGIVIVIISIYLTARIGRSLIRQLAELKQTLLNLAERRLPNVVERLQRGERVDVRAETPPLEFGTDELGEVARAFNLVQQTAVQAAVDQAELRNGIKGVFVNLARRSQGLVHRQLTLLDEMERRATDPDDLERLFAIDHLAARMRRHAEDLITLSGLPPGRRWRKPVPLVDVVRAAVGEVESYTRVVVMPVPKLALSGHAVADVIHLLAELIENATSFSPPHTKVQVNTQTVPSGFVVEVEDRGLGMSEEDMARYNQRLAQPPEFNLSDTVRLGLFVVARLAERHGISVHLRRSPYGGTTAIVLVPTSLTIHPEAIQAIEGDVQPQPSRTAADASGQVPALPRSRKPVAVSAAPAVPTAEISVDEHPTPGNDSEGSADGGLPRRVRQASLSTHLRETPVPPQPAVRGSVRERPPEQIRSMMAAFQRGSAQGRIDAETLDEESDDSKTTDR